MGEMKELAERLAKACPERFEFAEGDRNWVVEDHANHKWSGCLHSDADISEPMLWAFWGPLLDELKISTREVVHSLWDDCESELWEDTWLLSVATAVVEEFERRNGDRFRC